MTDRRGYSKGLRDELTTLTRTRILDAAAQLFLDRGYAGTTLAGVADAAGVSVQTVYNVVGSKSVLLKAVYDRMLAGDHAPLAMADRPMAQAVREASDPRKCLVLYAEMGRAMGERALPMVMMLLAQAATGDTEVATLAQTIENERATGTLMTAQLVADRFGLRPGMDVQTAADILWALTAPEVADRLVNRRKWGWDRYQQWLGRTMADALVGPDAPRD